MENTTLTPTTEPPNSVTEQTRPWPAEWMKKSWVRELHKRFTLIYLTRFTSLFREPQMTEDWLEIWGEYLAGLTGDQIAFGIKSVVARGDQWPPTMGEFKGHCMVAPLPTMARIEPPAVPATQKGTAQMARVKEIIGNQRPAGRWWAHNIMDKAKAGEYVLPIALLFAQQALSRESTDTADTVA